MVRITLAAVIGFAMAVSATPGNAYVVQVAASVPLVSAQDDSQLEDAIQVALEEILTKAIAFTPTVVTLQNVRVVADRIYMLFLIADREGEAMIETFSVSDTQAEEKEASP
jgi:hypothetical protein